MAGGRFIQSTSFFFFNCFSLKRKKNPTTRNWKGLFFFFFLFIFLKNNDDEADEIYSNCSRQWPHKKNKRKTRGVIAVVKREGCARVFSVAYFFLFLLFVSIRISSFFFKKMYFFLCLIFRRVLLLDLLEMAVAAWAFCRRLLLLSSSFFFNNFFYVVAFLVVAVVAVVVVVVVRPLRASFAVSVSFGHRSNLKKKTNRKMNKKWFSISNDSLLRQKKTIKSKKKNRETKNEPQPLQRDETSIKSVQHLINRVSKSIKKS